MGVKNMILISVHTLCGRAEIYVDDNKIKAFDVALFMGAFKNDDKRTVEAIIDDVYRNNFLSPIAKKNIFKAFPDALLKMGRPELAQVAMTDKTVTRLLTGV